MSEILAHNESAAEVAELVRCYDCNAEIEDENEQHETYNGHIICQACRDNEYFVCEQCGDIHHNDDSRQTTDDEYICEDCAANSYYRCVECDKYAQHTTTVGRHEVCESCLDRARNDCRIGYCESCDEYFWGEDYYSETSERSLCQSCFNDEENDSDRVIRDYSTAVQKELAWLGKSKVKFGIELEVECSDDTESQAEQVAERLEGFALLKHDGSISDGFEIVTTPADFSAQKRGWKPFFREHDGSLRIFRHLKSFQTSTCGIHIHVSRSPLEKNKGQLDRLSEFVNKVYNKRFIEYIAQRKESRWAAYHANKKTAFSTERYEALNFATGKETIEFRIFKGNLKESSFLKNLEFVHSLVSYTSDPSRRLSWNAYIKFVRSKQWKYPNLWAFIQAAGERFSSLNELGEI